MEEIAEKIESLVSLEEVEKRMAKKKIKETCENCRFACNEVTALSFYECRRNAPSVMNHYGSEETSQWPIVYRDKWCGEWEPKKSKGGFLFVGPESSRLIKRIK